MTKPKELPSREYLKEILDYDPQTGIFTWKKRIAIRIMPGNQAGHITADGYVSIGIHGSQCRAHRLAFVYMLGREPGDVIDHIDGDRLNNSWANLREVSQAANIWNRPVVDLHKGVSSRWTGVSRASGGKWQACICTNGKTKHLGVFSTEEGARDAYLEAKAIYHANAFHPHSQVSRSARTLAGE